MINMKDKNRVIIAAVVTLLVILTALIFSGNLLRNGKFPDILLPTGILIILMLFIVPFVKRRYFDVKQGYPYEDERSKKILMKASTQAFTLSIWWLLILMWYADTGALIPRHVAAAGIVGMALLFGFCYFYYSRKGDVE